MNYLHPCDALSSLMVSLLEENNQLFGRSYSFSQLDRLMNHYLEKLASPTSFVQVMKKQADAPMLKGLSLYAGQKPKSYIQAHMLYIPIMEKNIDDDRLSAAYADDRSQALRELVQCDEQEKALKSLKSEVYYSMLAFNKAHQILAHAYHREEDNQSSMNP